MRSDFMAKKKLFTGSIGEKTMREIWDLYTLSQTAKGITDITLRNYAQHLLSISKYLDIDVPMSEISKQDLDMMVVSMREAGLSNNSIATYVRRMRAFLGRCNLRFSGRSAYLFCLLRSFCWRWPVCSPAV